MANGIFNITQTDAQLQAILNKIQPLVTSGSTAPLGFGYGECTTAGATAAKTVSITNTVLTPGGIIAVNFVNAFTASSPTLSVNGSAAKPIKLYGNAMPMGKVHANTILVMYYDGTQFNVIGILSQTAAAPTGFVDLALPSGLLWCDHNVGASTPYEHGLYFSWGNVIGHAEGSGYDFSDAVYAGTPGAALTGNVPVNGTYDLARHNIGAPCRLPTVGEFQELNSNCDSEWTDEDGVAGRRFTSRINGNSIFFPASGDYDGTSLVSRGSLGIYWSSSYLSATNAYNLNFYSSNVYPAGNSSRRYGFSARAVQ
jgi:hypothetical protein